MRIEQYCDGEKPMLQDAGDYDEFRRLIDARRIELRMRMLDVDVDAGLQGGYYAKVACALRNYGPKTLGPILQALGVRIALIPSSVGTLPKRKVLQFANVTRLKNISSLGGRVSRSRKTDAEWSKFCRRAANVRWKKARRAKKIVAPLAKNPGNKTRGAAATVV